MFRCFWPCVLGILCNRSSLSSERLLSRGRPSFSTCPTFSKTESFVWYSNIIFIWSYCLARLCSPSSRILQKLGARDLWSIEQCDREPARRTLAAAYIVVCAALSKPKPRQISWPRSKRIWKRWFRLRCVVPTAVSHLVWIRPKVTESHASNELDCHCWNYASSCQQVKGVVR